MHLKWVGSSPALGGSENGFDNHSHADFGFGGLNPPPPPEICLPRSMVLVVGGQACWEHLFEVEDVANVRVLLIVATW